MTQQDATQQDASLDAELDGTEIAIVGLSGRFPGAGDLERFWHNLEKGIDAFTRVDREALVAAGLSRREANDPAWVPVTADLAESELFDATFFGYSPREAELLDPQQRILLELAWQAMENAGYETTTFPGSVGIFAGATTSTYLLYNLARRPDVLASTDPLQLLVANAADSLATRIAYKLDLRGPAFTVQCACSTSLVAVHLACQALLDEQCDMALAGGISINVRNRFGYRWQQGSILSPDGRCRAFDDEANGTIFGNGGALVVLRRAEDARRDGDTIHALIRATAVNNDGAQKVGYTAPSVDGQADVIAEALGASGVDAESIQYLEAHGTATALGDPIEIQALTKAYATYTERKQFCALGTVKSNIGHLDVAAGIAGLVKVVLALENKRLPPTLHNKVASSKITFAASPVYLLREAKDWPREGPPRRAGLSSFGFGGTNAHAILEEAPAAARRKVGAGPWLFPLSARSPAALAQASDNLRQHLVARRGVIERGELALGDVAFTLQRGRRHFSQRRAIVAAGLEELLQALGSAGEKALDTTGDAGPGSASLLQLAQSFTQGGSAAELMAGLPTGRRVPLPTYPFERKRYFIEAPREDEAAAATPATATPAATAGASEPALEPTLAPRQELHARSLSNLYVAPQSELETQIAGLWEKSFGVDQVGLDDNFFELGGDSFMATQLMARLRALTGAEVPLQKLFEAPTVRGLAAIAAVAATAAPPQETGPEIVAEARSAGDEAKAEIPVLPRPLPPQPLSLSQERMYFLAQLDRETSIYNLQTAVRLRGEIDEDLLEASFRKLLARHESLRTTFENIGQEPRQIIHDTLDAEIERLDLRAEKKPEEAPEEALRTILAERHGRPFDLARGPLVRFALLRLAPQEVVLLLVMHHIIADGWSMSVLIGELAALYQAAVRGQASPLAPMRLQYPDIAAWQRQRLSGTVRQELLDYWRGQLGGELESLQLPTDTPRGLGRGVRLAASTRALPATLSAAVRGLAREQSSTPFMVLLAAFGALLYRYSGQTRIRIGTPIANRNHKEVEGILGFLLNTLVLPLQIDGEQGFAALLRRTRDTALGAFAHQDLPLEMLIRELGLEDHGQGLFQMMFLYQNVPAPRLDLPNLELSLLDSDLESELGAMDFDWNLEVSEVGKELHLAITYNRVYFAAESIERTLRHLEVLLAGALAEPSRPLGELPLLEEAESREETQLAGAPAELDESPPVRQIAARAAEDSARPALLFEGGMWTRFELETRSNQLARHLIAAGAGHEVVVGLLLERSPELIAAMLAVMKAGAAYLPIDPAQPLERSLELLSEAGAPLLITQGDQLTAAPGLGEGRRVILLDEEAGAIAARPETPPEVPLFGEGAAYVIFTSGSTGRPKGVVVPHRALANFVAAASQRYPIGEADCVLQFASLAFDTSAEEIYPVLARGGALALRTDEMIAFPEVLLARCREWKVTVLDLPTAFWHELVAALESSGQRLGSPIKLLILGGEKPLPEKLAAFSRLIEPGLRVLNTYGPTEATVVATCADLSAEIAAWPADREASIGTPLPNVWAFVLDAAGRPQPSGVAGELHLGGAGLARGYLGAPAATAERFRPDACSGRAGARLYATGDRVRRRLSGELEYLGRVDFQVKIHGYRVEPGEIEAVMARHPALAEVAVLALGEAPRLELHAFAARAPGTPDAAPSGKELRHFLAERLAGHLVPAACHLLDKLPKTISGKIDRKALARLAAGLVEDGLTSATESRTFVAPRSDSEEVVCAIFAEVLGLEEVSVVESFFELGGHSLLLMQVLHQLQETFEVQFPLRRLYADPTPEGIAALAETLILEQIAAEEEN